MVSYIVNFGVGSAAYWGGERRKAFPRWSLRLVPSSQPAGIFPRMFDSTLWADKNAFNLDLIRALPLCRSQLEKLAYAKHEISDEVVAISRSRVRWEGCNLKNRHYDEAFVVKVDGEGVERRADG